MGRTPERESSVGVLLYEVRFWTFSGFNMKQKRRKGSDHLIAWSPFQEWFLVCSMFLVLTLCQAPRRNQRHWGHPQDVKSRGTSSLAQCLPSLCEALASTPGIAQTKVVVCYLVRESPWEPDPSQFFKGHLFSTPIYSPQKGKSEEVFQCA